MVVLGPNSNEQFPPGTLIEYQSSTVVSFGSEFAVQLPIAPDEWTTEEPEVGITPLILAEGELYVRCIFTGYGRAVRGLVNMKNGRVSFNNNPRVAAYALNWELLVADAKGELRRVVANGKV